MADLRGQQLKDSYQNVVTRGTGNKLENGNGVEFADLDDKASLPITVTKKDSSDLFVQQRPAISNDVPGLSVSITRKADGTSIMIQGCISVSAQESVRIGIVPHKNGNPIGLGDPDGDRQIVNTSTVIISEFGTQSIPFLFLDDNPGNDMNTYTIRLAHTLNESGEIRVNRPINDSNADSRFRNMSFIAAQECI